MHPKKTTFALATLLCLITFPQPIRAADAPTPLRDAATVHQLDADAVNQHPKVEIEGIVTHFNRRLGDGFFIQDETDGIYVRLLSKKIDLQMGERLRITGTAAPGAFAPTIQLETLVRLGSSPLPKSIEVNAAQLATGAFDSRRVRIQGIIRSTQTALPGLHYVGSEGHLALTLRSDGQSITVGINDFQAASLALTDAKVIVEGVAAGIFSHNRQLLSPVVLLETDAEIRILKNPPSLDSIPLRASDQLFSYSPNGFSENRVLIKGRLLGQKHGRWLAIEDHAGALFVEATDAFNFNPGDSLEIYGFPEMREQTLWLMNATARRLGPGPPPPIQNGSSREALQNPSEIWRIEGLLTGLPRPGENSWVLVLNDGEREFEAILPASQAPFPPNWRPGARIAVTGISQPYFLPGHRVQMRPHPEGLRLHVSSLDDIAIIEAGPWWNAPGIARTFAYALGGALLVLALAIGIALLLARKNQALEAARSQLALAQSQLSSRFSARTGEWQTELAARHAAEADFALLTAERTRMARELHDTIEQSIASAALHLDAAKAYFREKPAESERLLVDATKHLRDSQAEVRRSVWGLRSVKLENATLPDALEQLSRALTDAQGPSVTFNCEGKPFEIPPGAASHLFRVAQEGITNALKHATAKNIILHLEFQTKHVELSIEDDGQGFDVDGPSKSGHYGIRGIKERAKALDATLNFQSQDGRGTRITFRLPRKQPAPKTEYATL